MCISMLPLRQVHSALYHADIVAPCALSLNNLYPPGAMLGSESAFYSAFLVPVCLPVGTCNATHRL